MISERYAIAMTETLHYLKGICQADINKIPNKLMIFLEENALKNYKCEFDYSKPLKNLTLRDETRGLIAMICLNYWCETEEQKKYFKEHLNENEKKYQEYLQVKFNPDNIFKEKEIISEDNVVTKNIDLDMLPAKVEKESRFKKILKSIKNFFQKNKNDNNNP